MCTHYYYYAVLSLYSAVLRQHAVIAIFLKNKFTTQTIRPRIIYFYPKNIVLICNMNSSQLYPYDIKKKTYGAITLIPVLRDEKKGRKSLNIYMLTQSGQNRIL